jgi:hypothetical protein
MRRIICGLSTLAHKRHDFREEVIEHKCVLVSYNFLIHMTERHIMDVHRSSRKVPAMLPDFYETWILWIVFRRIFIYQTSLKPVHWEHGRTDITKLRSALFCDITRRIVIIPYRRFGATYRPNLQELIFLFFVFFYSFFFLNFLTIEYGTCPETSTLTYLYTLRSISDDVRFQWNMMKLIAAFRNFGNAHIKRLLRF